MNFPITLIDGTVTDESLIGTLDEQTHTCGGELSICENDGAIICDGPCTDYPEGRMVTTGPASIDGPGDTEYYCADCAKADDAYADATPEEIEAFIRMDEAEVEADYWSQ